jgi:thioredoxin 1
MERVSEKFTSIEIFKVDVDTHKDLATEWGIKGIPTVIFIKDGKEVGKTVGLKSESEISGLMKNLSS